VSVRTLAAGTDTSGRSSEYRWWSSWLCRTYAAPGSLGTLGRSGSAVPGHLRRRTMDQGVGV